MVVGFNLPAAKRQQVAAAFLSDDDDDDGRSDADDSCDKDKLVSGSNSAPRRPNGSEAAALMLQQQGIAQGWPPARSLGS